MRLLPLLLVLALTACGGADAPTPAPTSPAPELIAPTPTAEAEPAPALAFPLEWAWTDAPEALETVDPGGLTCRFASSDGRSTVECIERRTGARRWGLDVRDGSTSAVFLRDGETLYVARFPRAGFGAVVERYHLDRGERRWRVAIDGLLVGIGGLASQSIELAREEGRLVVRGHDAGGRWAVAIDADVGTVLGSRVFEGDGAPIAEAPAAPAPLATMVPWQWDGPSLDERRRNVQPNEVSITTPDGGTCRWRAEPNGDPSDDDRAHLECLDPSGARRWGIDDASPWPDMEGRALAIDGGVLYVLSFHRAATGASVTAHDLATGVERWEHWLSGIGPIAHSGYAAWAEMRMSSGRPVVFGWEASGRYVEILDPATGATLYNRLVPDGE